MDLNRYKMRIPPSKAEPDNLGLLGVWIGFAGIFLISFTTAFSGNFKLESAVFSTVIGICYFLSWLGQHYKTPVVILTLGSEILALLILIPLVPNHYVKFASTICDDVGRFQSMSAGCLKYSTQGILWCYLLHFASIAIVAAYYHHKRKANLRQP